MKVGVCEVTEQDTGRGTEGWEQAWAHWEKDRKQAGRSRNARDRNIQRGHREVWLLACGHVARTLSNPRTSPLRQHPLCDWLEAGRCIQRLEHGTRENDNALVNAIDFVTFFSSPALKVTEVQENTSAKDQLMYILYLKVCSHLY